MGSVHAFNDLLIEAGLDAREIMKALEESIELGFVDWGKNKDVIMKLLLDPEPEDLQHLVTNSEAILRPLEEWLIMERNLGPFRKDSLSKYEFYELEYRCSQIQNFILTLKLNTHYGKRETW